MTKIGKTQKIIIIVFIVLFIIIVGSLIYTLIAAGNVSNWPPTSQNCPDYWLEGANNICYNSTPGNSGGIVETQVNFSGATLCDKYNWSNASGNSYIKPSPSAKVLWDGINYGNGKYTPCDADYKPVILK
jgi:hypothetical protein